MRLPNLLTNKDPNSYWSYPCIKGCWMHFRYTLDEQVSSKVMGILGHAFYPHFSPFPPPPPPRTTFSQLGPLLKIAFSTHKNAFRYIIQLHHHIIYLTYISKSFQLNSISYIHTKQSSHNIYISNIYI